ncbi:hypothetical protein NC652_026708 [Populus alba x Populus x berolinensis]|nr:hypothetical protein NC652_026708 [Populus alba x Populus x berolinensis]
MESSEEKIGEHQIEFKAQNFRYLPFGNGRRGCPGASFAMLVTHATLGALVQCCGWKIKDGEKIDLRPGPGFSAEMAHSLVSITSLSGAHGIWYELACYPWKLNVSSLLLQVPISLHALDTLIWFDIYDHSYLILP